MDAEFWKSVVNDGSDFIIYFREVVGFSKDFFLTAHFSELMWNGVNGYKIIINKF